MDADKLETPEEEPRPCAGFWLRAVALLVDGAILSAGFLALTAIVAFFETYDPGASLHLQFGRIVIALLGSALYSFATTSRTGQTLGKACVGIRVERLDGSLPSPGAVLIRYLAFGFFVLLTELYLGLADGVFLALRRDRRSLHDLVAGTVVRRVAPRRIEAVVAAGLFALALCHSPIGVAAISERYLYDTVDTPWYPEHGQGAPETLALTTGDSPVINRLAYRLRPPAVGDVALCVSHLPVEGAMGERNETGLYAFVHVIGVPGDTLSVRGGRVDSTDLFADDEFAPSDSIDWPKGGGKCTVPEGMVVVLKQDGFMRPELLPRDALRGQVVSIIWPPRRMRILPRGMSASHYFRRPPLWLRLDQWPLALPGQGQVVPNIDWH